MQKFLFFLTTILLLAACNNNTKLKQVEALQAKQATIDSLDKIVDKEKTIDSMNSLKSSNELNGNSSIRNQASSASTSSSIPVATKKKGWSSAAKGAVIGAGAGAIIDKNKKKKANQ